MVCKAVEDLETLLIANYDYTNVASLSAKPDIRLAGENKPGFQDNGEIVLGQERLARSEIITRAYEDMVYLIDAKVTYQGSSSITLKEMVAEIRTVFNANNISGSRTYAYAVTYVWDGLYEERNSTVEILIEARELLVSRL